MNRTDSVENVDEKLSLIEHSKTLQFNWVAIKNISIESVTDQYFLQFIPNLLSDLPIFNKKIVSQRDYSIF